MNTTMRTRLVRAAMVTMMTTTTTIAACGMIGCEKEASTSTDASGAAGVTAKSSPADPGNLPQPASPTTPAATGPAPVASVAETPAPGGESKRESADGVSWQSPADWSLGPPAPMRLATLRHSTGGPEITITAFPGNVGGVLLNVNRWRAQIGLPPVTDDAEAEQLMTDVDVAGRKVRTVDMTGSGGRVVVATVPGDGRLYFFKMTGPPDAVAARKDAFDQIVKSIRVE